MSTSPPHSLQIFANPAALITFVLIVLHQSLIASSAYFLTQMLEHYQAGIAYHQALLFYLAAMILPFIPGCLSFVTTQTWINTLHRRFTLEMARVIYGNPCMYRESQRKADFESAISRNALPIISTYVTLSHDFLSLTLNSVLSILVIGMILPNDIAFGYAISLALSIFAVFALTKTVQSLSIETEQRFAQFGHTLHKAWDNVVLGNTYHARLWQEEFDQNSTPYYRATQTLSLYKQLGNITIALVSLLPTAYLIYHVLLSPHLEAGLVAATIVNLTRIFHILNSLSTFAYELIEWTSASARMKYLLGFLTCPKAVSLPLTPAGSITLNGTPITNYQTVLDDLHQRDCGRLTVRGENGAGKSTLLLALKNALPNETLLLPAHHEQLCWGAPHEHLSTGQRARAILTEIAQQTTSIKYLLLDEWDANLDQDNRSLVNAYLETLSQHIVVIEVRH